MIFFEKVRDTEEMVIKVVMSQSNPYVVAMYKNRLAEAILINSHNLYFMENMVTIQKRFYSGLL